MIAAESRFNLAYDASHALALAALRIHGFRADKRYVVFQALQHALGVDIPTWRLLDRCPAVRGGAAADLLGDAAHGVETSTPAPRPNRSTSS